MKTKFQEFIPKSFDSLRDYSFATFRKDLIAGLTVGMIALPLAMAFAIASGVDPSRGLYTAIVAGFLISLLGGSRVQIGGPTGAFVVIIYDIIQRTGYAGLCASTMIAAVLLIMLGLFRIGSLIRFVPHSLITGFTAGIALLIFLSQIKDFFGLSLEIAPATFIDRWLAYAQAFPSLDLVTLSFSVGALCTILLTRKFFPSIPWGVVAIVGTTAVASFFHFPIETIASRFGEIPKSLPFPDFSNFSIPLGNWRECFKDGLTIAFLGGIESLLSAVIGDKLIGGRHRSNCELVAQGIANCGSILFGGIPATGAIARTATNVKSGAQTPIAGMIHAVTLFLIILLFSSPVSKIPLAALSAVLMMVAWNMSEMPHFIQILRGPIGDKLILTTSFLLTVFVDITVAIAVGMILASFLFMQQMSKVSKINLIDSEDTQIYEIQGPLFFGTAHLLQSIQPPKKLILKFGSPSMIDATGAHAIKEFYSICKKKNIHLTIEGIQKEDLEKFHLYTCIKDAL